MTLRRLRRDWDLLGRRDPLWAILTWHDKRGNRWRADEFFATGVDEIAEVTSYVESLGVTLDRDRALDFGCGVGRLTQALADRFDDVWGVDIAPSMIERAERYDRHPDRCHYIVNDRPDLRVFEDDSFGFVYSNIVLQHVQPRFQRAYIKELVRVLAPGGALVFQLPSERIWSDASAGGRRGALGAVRERVKAITPSPVLRFYRRARWGRRGPIKMWGMPRDDVIGLLRGERARILDVRPDRYADAWVGFRYAVTKP